MNTGIIDRVSVALIVLGAGAYLAWRLAARLRSALTHRANGADDCGHACGCGRDADA